MTDQEIVAVVQAKMRGEKIQYKPKQMHEWANTDSPNWGFDELDYRVKPESRSIYLVEVQGFLKQFHSRSRAMAKENAKSINGRVVEFIENVK